MYVQLSIVLVNGQPSIKITSTSGFRQGDPLSTYLFLLRVEGFSSMIDNAGRISAIKGVSVARGETYINHMMFAYEYAVNLRCKNGKIWKVLCIDINKHQRRK